MLSSFALWKTRCSDKFAPHIWKFHEERAVMGIIHVYLLLRKKYISLIQRILKLIQLIFKLLFQNIEKNYGRKFRIILSKVHGIQFNVKGTEENIVIYVPQ